MNSPTCIGSKYLLIVTFVGLFLWGNPGLLQAQTPSTKRFTLDEAIAQAIAHNPALRAARYQIAVAQANLKWSGRLNDPEFEIGGNTDRWGLRDGESLLEVAIAQKFPLTGRLKRERELSEADLALAKAEVRVAEWILAAQVREAGTEALALQQQIELRKELQVIVAELVQIIDSALQRAEASELDLTEAKLEVQTQVAAIRSLEGELTETNGKLRALLGFSPDTQLSIGGGLFIPGEENQIPLSQKLIAQRPDLQLSLLREQRAQANIALASSRRWEDVAVKLFMERESAVDAPEGLERNTFVGLGFSIPLPLWTPKDRLTEAPKQQLAAAQASSDALAASIANEIASANDEVRNRRLVWEQTAGENLDLARQNIREVREAWQDGRASILRLQRAQERALALEESAVESLFQYHRALARLRKAAALDLPSFKPEN